MSEERSINLGHYVLAILASSLISFALALLSTEYYHDYGLMLFLGLPIFCGALSSMIYAFKNQCTRRDCINLSLLSGLLICFWFLCLGFEGIVCIIMALPILSLSACAGGLLGFMIIEWFPTQKKHMCAAALLLMPLLISVDGHIDNQPPTRQVMTSVTINGDIHDIWKTVIQFPEIKEVPTGIFNYGIAYPIKASIEGEGVGALRLCTFNTGDFVEPISVWDAPTLLAFSVIKNPAPMEETGFYEQIHPPHLDGFMVSEKGQFKLIDNKDGTVTLEGTTWYHHDLAPKWYWGLLSDEIIHRIHYRVLNHIKRHVEK